MLSKRRLAFTPQLPSLLQEPNKTFFEAQETESCSPPIQKLFPKTAHQKLLALKKGGSKPFSPMKVGAVFSGGQASGGHNVISGLFDALQKLHPKCELLGFLDGPSGIVLGKALSSHRK